MPDCTNCGDPVCAAAAAPCDASWQDVAECQRRAKERALAEVAGLCGTLADLAQVFAAYDAAREEIKQLRAELAEARKPRWVSVPEDSEVALITPADRATAGIWRTVGGWRWRLGRGKYFDSGNAEEAKAAAEQACGVEAANG